MSPSISKEEAARKAEKEIRFNVGTLPYLSNPVELYNSYYFLIKYTPVTVRPQFTDREILFYPEQTIGALWIDEEDELHRTDDTTLNENIRVAKDKVEAGKLKPLCYDKLVEEGVAEELTSA
jgi:hypothetical protein